jgi:beta-glucosidase
MVVVGAATSSLHSEGAAPTSDWGGWEAAGWVPHSGDGNGFGTRYAEDAALLASHGLGSMRLTLEWARLEPRRSDRGFDADEVERYRGMLRAVRSAGLQAWACLVHTSLPGWFSEDERGFLDDRMARRVWPRHVDRVGEAFGDLVDGWVTMHEPVRHALDAWLHGTLPPGRHDGDDAALGLRNLLAADAEAARLLHVPGEGSAPVATCRWLPPVFPLDSSPEARAAARHAEDLVWRSWREADEPTSWLGVSCSYALGVGADGSFRPWPAGTEAGPLGWAPWPEALGESLHRVGDEHPGRPVVVLTGAWDGDATRRSATLRGLDTAIAEAVDDRVALEQVHWWSAVDGYEGWAGFDAPSGLFDRDRNPTGMDEIRTSFVRRDE